MLLPLLALSPAHAGQLYTDVSEGYWFQDLDAKNWIRSFPNPEGGWFLLHGIVGDYGLRLLSDDMVLDTSEPLALTGQDGLVDHGISSCPDGGYLHVSFSHPPEHDYDTIWSFRYDADWNLLQTNVILDGESGTSAPDALSLCASDLKATAYTHRDGVDFRLIRMDNMGAFEGTVDLEMGVNATGASMVAGADPGTYTVVGTRWNFSWSLLMRQYDSDLELIDDKELYLPLDPEQQAFWPQGHMRIGDYNVIAHVVDNQVEEGRTQSGNIWLSFFDSNWDWVETAVIVEENESMWAFMRPGLSRKGDQLLVTYDHPEGPYLTLVTLDLVALGVEEGDSGSTDTGGGDTGGDEDGSSGTGCGCGTSVSSGPASGVWGLVVLAGAWRRRRS